MVEMFLGDELAKEIFEAGKLSAMSEKKAVAPVAAAGAAAAGTGLTLSAVGTWLKDLVGGGAEAVATGAEKSIDLAKGLALAGLATGAIGGVGYNLVKERLQKKSPEEEMQRKIEATYARKSREKEDAKWMSDVRAKRDRLAREWKKMTPGQYAKDYDELMGLLNQRRA